MEDKNPINLKRYKSLIKERVSQIQDENWKWRVKSISENIVQIYWSYLKGETNDSFILKLYKDDICYENEAIMSARDAITGESIDCYIVADTITGGWQVKIESAIVALIEEIADYAHSRY